MLAIGPAYPRRRGRRWAQPHAAGRRVAAAPARRCRPVPGLRVPRSGPCAVGPAL